jgi:hypothetical protein
MKFGFSVRSILFSSSSSRSPSKWTVYVFNNYKAVDHDRDHLGSQVVLHFLGRLDKAPACQYLLGTSTVTNRIKWDREETNKHLDILFLTIPKHLQLGKRTNAIFVSSKNPNRPACVGLGETPCSITRPTQIHSGIHDSSEIQRKTDQIVWQRRPNSHLDILIAINSKLNDPVNREQITHS